ncbi:hypothetical protein J7E71_24835 [Mesobacillus foraminis]|uniref:hypothetical protein n=1 Tax=Mesobacillus foraminis TaxID=279826 RepID=UPI001BE7FAD6|nr:hypothetical protein [Mesobacillus foraminis]MBT2759103.1 hypothetical protein [Mesobacillus foraminis]
MGKRKNCEMAHAENTAAEAKPKRKKVKKVKDLIKKLPPGYPVSRIMVKGATEDVTMFLNEKDGLAYFNVDGQVGAYEARNINGILFGAAEAAEEEEEA